MAVPEGKRSQSKLKVITKTKAMVSHTVITCSNNDNFPKRERWTIANRIVVVALEIMEQADFANSIYVTTASDYTLRRTAQTSAIASTARLLGLIDLAYVRYKIAGEKIEYWTSLVLEVRKLLIGWRKADYKLYNDLIKG